jgi:hypothetical protein
MFVVKVAYLGPIFVQNNDKQTVFVSLQYLPGFSGFLYCSSRVETTFFLLRLLKIYGSCAQILSP